MIKSELINSYASYNGFHFIMPALLSADVDFWLCWHGYRPPVASQGKCTIY